MAKVTVGKDPDLSHVFDDPQAFMQDLAFGLAELIDLNNYLVDLGFPGFDGLDDEEKYIPFIDRVKAAIKAGVYAPENEEV